MIACNLTRVLTLASRESSLLANGAVAKSVLSRVPKADLTLRVELWVGERVLPPYCTCNVPIVPLGREGLRFLSIVARFSGALTTFGGGGGFG